MSVIVSAQCIAYIRAKLGTISETYFCPYSYAYVRAKLGAISETHFSPYSFAYS